MQAARPGAEGYFLTPEMARRVAYDTDYGDGGWDGRRGRGPGGVARFGGAGQGYGGDYRAGRGGYDAGEFFVNRHRGGYDAGEFLVNRHRGGGTGYHPGYERNLGMRGGMRAGRHGYGGDYGRGEFRARYDGGYRAGGADAEGRAVCRTAADRNRE